jgi:hypothetical protein
MGGTAPDSAAVLDDVRRLRGTAAPPIEDVERVLTDGYACVLWAEGERRRLRGRLEQRAATLDPTPDVATADELRTLARGIARADSEIEELRSALGDLAARQGQRSA